MKTLIDKNGSKISNDDILFDGKIHHRYCENTVNGTYLLSGDGYHHEPTPEFLATLERVGTFEEKKDLLICD